MRRGGAHAEVALLQADLNRLLRSDEVQVSGHFDDATEVAVRAFQQLWGQEVTGEVGVDFLRELERRIGRRAPEEKGVDSEGEETGDLAEGP